MIGLVKVPQLSPQRVDPLKPLLQDSERLVEPMVSATLPDLGAGFVEKMTGVLETRKIEDWTSHEVAAHLLTCNVLRTMFAMAYRSIEAALSEGVDARV